VKTNVLDYYRTNQSHAMPGNSFGANTLKNYITPEFVGNCRARRIIPNNINHESEPMIVDVIS
jgi:phosphomethylpyrimidine synthase